MTSTTHTPLAPNGPITPNDAVPAFEYQQRLAIERPKAWRGILALLALLAGLGVFSTVFTLLAMTVETIATGTVPDGITPTVFAGAMLGLAVLTPWSMVLQKWFFGVPMASLHSVLSRFRWDLFGRTVAIAVPLFALLQIVYLALPPQPTRDYPVSDLMAYLVIGLTLMPLQAAGEEYAFRGLAFRIAASWGRGPRTGLVLGILVSSLLFAVAHVALDPWLNLYYLTFGAVLCVITWRTGGLEVAIVLHAVNNVVASLVSVALSQDVDAGLDRSAGAASAVMLIPCVLLIVVAAVVWWRTPQAARAPAPTATTLAE